MLVSAEGRARFGEWPDVIADDYFLDGLFAAGEKRRVADVEVTVLLPRRFWACVSRKARVHQGKRDVLAAGLRVHPEDRSGAGSSLLGVVRSRPGPGARRAGTRHRHGGGPGARRLAPTTANGAHVLPRRQLARYLKIARNDPTSRQMGDSLRPAV